jgi:hypothetical protein
VPVPDAAELEVFESRLGGCVSDNRDEWLKIYANTLVNKHQHGL